MHQQWLAFLDAEGGIFSQGRLLHFGHLIQELTSLETQDCLTDLSGLGFLRISGNDAKTFLQGQITYNLNQIIPGKMHLAAHCNQKGRMQSLFSIFIENNSNENPAYYLKMPHNMVALAEQNFKKFAIFSKVVIENVTSKICGLGLYGPNASALLASICQTESIPSMEVDNCLTIDINQGSVIICKLPGRHQRYELFGSIVTIQALWLELKKACQLVSPQGWELLDIRAGLPTVYPETIDEILPHYANLSILNGISYDKGCYIGQEIIARMQYRGKIKKHMYRTSIQTDEKAPSPGNVLCVPTHSDPLGIVVRANTTGSTAFECLVIIDDQFANFENVHLHSVDGPKFHHLALPYQW